MAQVFQCDACGKVGTLKALVTVGEVKKQCCGGCVDRVTAVLNPKPRGPKPASAADNAGG